MTLGLGVGEAGREDRAEDDRLDELELEGLEGAGLLEVDFFGAGAEDFDGREDFCDEDRLDERLCDLDSRSAAVA